MAKNDEQKKLDYLNNVLNGNTSKPDLNLTANTTSAEQSLPITSNISNLEYQYIEPSILPAGRFYPNGVKIGIRAAKVAEIQAYSMVDDTNMVDVTEKMNELLSRNIIYFHPNGSRGTYKDIRDCDRFFIIFMIRELTFQGGTTLNKDFICESCGHEFKIPFRATPNPNVPATFEMREKDADVEDYFNPTYGVYELFDGDEYWTLAPPTIGIQEAFYEDMKRLVREKKTIDTAFVKIMQFLLHDRNDITQNGIAAKLKEFKTKISLELFQAMDEIVTKSNIGIKGLYMKCPECGVEAHTDITFPDGGGATSIFKVNNVLGRFKRKS